MGQRIARAQEGMRTNDRRVIAMLCSEGYSIASCNVGRVLWHYIDRNVSQCHTMDNPYHTIAECC